MFVGGKILFIDEKTIFIDKWLGFDLKLVLTLGKLKNYKR